MTRAFLVVLAGLTLASCTTPYPYDTLGFEGVPLDSNRAPRGSDAFCQRYAEQSAVNQYDTDRDAGDGFGGSLFNRQRAEAAGERAYRRCRNGRTN